MFNIQAAIKSGSVQQVAQCLSYEGNINNLNKIRRSLDLAAKLGHADICQLIISVCSPSRALISSALGIACQHNQFAVAKLLVQHVSLSSDLEVLTAALVRACLATLNWYMVNWLLDVGKTSQFQRCAWSLFAATARDDVTVVRYYVNAIGPSQAGIFNVTE
jgi:hypothetical protein